MKKLLDLKALRTSRMADISKLQEIVERSRFKLALQNYDHNTRDKASKVTDTSAMSGSQLKLCIESGMLTFLLHCEARIASNLGCGFYTIGPCGEELLSAVALSLRPTDSIALHYRHVSTAICRQLMAGKSMESIALDRARGFVCSVKDPVTAGKHCAIGGSEYDFIVTSTLASQAPPAVGRALSISLSNSLLKASQVKFPSDSISYVSVGDGSVNNAHFLASINLARYSQHRTIKCPIVFGVSDNGRCISLPGFGWLRQFAKQFSDINVSFADGRNLNDVYVKSKQAIDYSRQRHRPSLIIFENLPRRFGHAATDRQLAYLTEAEIAAQASTDPLGVACSEAISSGLYTAPDLLAMFDRLQAMVEEVFETAVNEPKIDSREALILSNSAPLVGGLAPPAPSKGSPYMIRYLTRTADSAASSSRAAGETVASRETPEVMRKQMTRVYDEILANNKGAVYIGEDVTHGGYYLVTSGLAQKHPGRVIDFPPDETTLVGSGMGFSQAGLTPIVEIPYAKYLDCAHDMFTEAVISNWLTDGKQRTGMLVRLQGFDKGVFGGNFHTHNSLVIPPGLDVVCYSNGADYVRGIRYAMKQAAAGRIVMSVDSTDLLNRRHLCDDGSKKDDLMLTRYPAVESADLSFNEIVMYSRDNKKAKKKAGKEVLLVTYGNGLPTSVLAMESLLSSYDQQVLSGTLEQGGGVNVAVVDCPYLSSPPKQLTALLAKKKYTHVLFCDPCKQNSMPLGNMAVLLQREGLLAGVHWQAVGAAATYNPLSRTLTFLSQRDIEDAVNKLVAQTSS